MLGQRRVSSLKLWDTYLDESEHASAAIEYTIALAVDKPLNNNNVTK